MIRNVYIMLHSASYLHVLIVFCIYCNSQKLHNNWTNWVYEILWTYV